MFEGLFQPTHLIIILVIAWSFSGRARFPSGSSLGKAIRGFKKSMNELTGDEGTNNGRIEGKDKRQSHHPVGPSGKNPCLHPLPRTCHNVILDSPSRLR